MNSAELFTQDELYAMLSCILLQGKILSVSLNIENAALLTCDPNTVEDLTSALVKIKKTISKKQTKMISDLMSMLAEELG